MLASRSSAPVEGRSLKQELDIPAPAPVTAMSVLLKVFAIGLTQIIGWGTSFSAIAVLGTKIGNDLDLPREVIFGGVTAMLVVGAFFSPYCAVLVERYGPRLMMAFGSLMGAAALALIAVANGVAVYWIGWGLFGAAVPLALSNTAVPAVVHVSGPYARRAVTGLTIIAGVTSAFFLPIGAWLESQIGWRQTFAFYALLHVIICIPLYWLFLPAGRITTKAGGNGADAPWEGVLAPHQRRRAFILLSVWGCLEGILVWGFNMQAIDILQGLGLSTTAAIGVWMLAGPSQSASRIGDLLLAGRYSVMSLGIVAAGLAPIGFGILLLAGTGVWSASVMAICYGLGHGLFVIARNMLPLRLFGLKEFGLVMGRLGLPQNLANGVAPLLFAAVLTHSGADGAVWIAFICSILSLGATLLLARELATSRSTPSASTNAG